MPSFSASAEAERPEGVPPPPRLNPFAFVSDTSLRFALLIMFIFSAAGTYWIHIGGNWSYIDTGAHLTDPQDRYEVCLRGVRMSGSALFDADKSRLILACTRDYAESHLPFILGGLALLITVTLVLYALYPVWISYRWHASSLQEEDVPDLLRELRALVSQAGLRRVPRFLWNPLGTVPAALAYGAFGQNRVAMTGALVAQFLTEPAAFRAVVLHELAHLRNGDVSKAMLAVTIWWAFVVTVLPFHLATLAAMPFDLLDTAYSLLRTLAVAGLMLLTRNAVLRARELYADARASAWAYDPAGLASVLQRLKPVAGWRRFVSTHPAPPRRIALLERTDELFRFSSWDAFGLGTAAGMLTLFTSLMAFFVIAAFDLTPERISMSGAAFIAVMGCLLLPFLLVALFGVVILAVVTWRGVFQELMRRRRSSDMVRLSFTFSAGVVIGLAALLLLPLLEPAGHRLAALPSAATFILWSIAILLALWLVLGVILGVFLYWIAASAAAWLPLLLRQARPGATLLASLVSVFMFFVLMPLGGAAVLAATGPVGEGGATGLLATIWHLALVGSAFPYNVFAWASVIVLWAWPLAPALLARVGGNSDAGGWVWLDSAPAEAVPPLAPLRPDRAALIGAVGGAAFGLALSRIAQLLPEEWAYMASLHGEVVPAHIRMMLAAILLQGVMATMTVFAVPRLRPIHALFAANVAGLVMAIAIRLHLLSQYGWRGPGLLATAEVLIQPIIMGGAVVVLPTVIVVRILDGLFRVGTTMVHGSAVQRRGV